MRISAVETLRYRFPLDPPFHAAWDPVPRTRAGRDRRRRPHRRGRDGLRERRRPARPRPPRTPSRRRRSAAHRGRARDRARRSTSTAAGRGRSRWRSGISSVARSDTPLWKLLGGRSERILAYASSGELVEPDERARRCVALRDGGRPGGQAPLPPRRLARRRRRRRARARGGRPDLEIMVDANQGWRMPGDREPRWDVATAAQCARALEPLGVYWLEEPLRTDDLDGYAALRRADVAPARSGRDGALGAGGARPRPPRQRRRRPDRRGARARDRRLPSDRRAGRSRAGARGRRTRGRTATGSW